jgi:hypothetical protein
LDAILATLLVAQQVEAVVVDDPETGHAEVSDHIESDPVAIECHREDTDPILTGDQASDHLEWCPSW